MHGRKHVIRRQLRLRLPFFRPSPRVHQHHPAAGLGANPSHFRIPEKSTHIVHNFRPGSHRRSRRCGLIGVHGNNRFRSRSQNPLEHRQQPSLLLFGTNRRPGSGALRSPRVRTRPRALRAQVQQVRTLVQQADSMSDRRLRIEKPPPIAERVRRDIHHPAHQRPPPQFQGAGAQFPRRNGSIQSRHSLPFILNSRADPHSGESLST